MSGPVWTTSRTGSGGAACLTAEARVEAQLVRHVDLPSQRGPNGEEIARRGNVVDADDSGARVDSLADRGERTGETVGRRALAQRAHELLARRREQQRPAEHLQLPQPA